MAHELDRLSDGTAAVFSVRDTPWHREGTVLHDAPSLEQALRLGGLDFEVEGRPLFTRPRVSGQLPEGDEYRRVKVERSRCASGCSDRPGSSSSSTAPLCASRL